MRIAHPARKPSHRTPIAAVVLVGLLLAAAVALASGTKTASKTVALHAAARADATCGAGKRPQLAGFSTTLQNLGPYVHPRALTIGGRTVHASAANEQGPAATDGPGKVTAFAYCGSGQLAGKAAAWKTLPPGSRSSVAAQCPKGTSVAAGGFRADIAPSGHGAAVYVDGLERVSARRWRASGINDGSAAGKLEARAYCTAGSPQLTTVTHSVQVPPRESRTVTATCPKGTSLALGGVRSQHYGSGYGELQLSSMRRTGSRGWRVGALKFEFVVGKLTAIAYCR